MTSERWAHIQKQVTVPEQGELIKKCLTRPTRIVGLPHDENVRLMFLYVKERKAYLMVLKRRWLYYHVLLDGQDTMSDRLSIYYDEEGDYCEIKVGSSKGGVFENLGEGIFQKRDEKTRRIVALAIHDFKRRTRSGKHLLLPVSAQLSEKT